MSKVVVLGSKGMLGTELMGVLGRGGFESEGLDLPEFDITDLQQLKEAVSRADIVVNCAAYTNVEKAESEPELAYAVNGRSVGLLGKYAAAKGISVLHISTDFVFDGRLDRPYTESDATNPISVYGETKLAGEQLLLESGARACILRLQWSYGKAGTNFVLKMIEAAKTRDCLKVVDDQVGSPTATVEVAKAIRNILARKPFAEGIYHYAASGYVSRYEMAKFIFEMAGIDVETVQCKSSEYKTQAKRPLNSRFNCGKIEGLLGETIRGWQGPLEEFVRQL